MKEFLKLSKKNKREVIDEYSARSGLKFDIVEKDIWVCYVLQKLFSNDKLKNHLVFKGGTCLSKVYSTIDRFSEDVDITLNRSCLKVEGESKKAKKVKKQIKYAAISYVKDVIYPELFRLIEDDLGNNEWALKIDENDQQTIMFTFPSCSSNVFSANFPIDLDNYSYIKRDIKLEFGAMGEVWPSNNGVVKPYISELMPAVFDSFEVEAIDIQRNFVEKLLILHSIYMRPEGKVLNDRYSRHYYDVYAIIKSGKAQGIERRKDILESVIKNKAEFWQESWVNYEGISSLSNLNLIPNQKRIDEIKKDYEKMQVMFFNESNPSFEEILDVIRKFHLGL